MDEQVISRGIIAMFKIIDDPGSTDMVGMPDQFIRLVDEKLPTLFSCLLPDKPIVMKPLDFREMEDRYYPQKYLLVLGALCRILGTHCYTKEILEEGRLEPKQEIIIIAYQTEAAVLYHLARYLYTMNRGIWNRVKDHRPEGMHPNEHKAEFISNFYYQIWRVLQPRLTYREFTQKKLNKNLQNRDDKVLQYLIDNLKFEYRIKDIKPQYGGDLNLDKYKIEDGKFSKHHLLWA